VYTDLLLLSFSLGLPVEARGEEAETVPPYAVGEHLPRFELTDQHGRRSTVDEQTELLVFLPDRAAGKLLHAALAGAPPDFLAKHHTVCIADISGMPRLVARFIALPKMRDYPYPLLLAENAELDARMPRRTAAATLLRLKQLQIVSLDFAQTPAAVASALVQPPFPTRPESGRGNSKGGSSLTQETPP